MSAEWQRLSNQDYLRGFGHAARQIQNDTINENSIKYMLGIIIRRKMYDDGSTWMRGWVDGILASIS